VAMASCPCHIQFTKSYYTPVSCTGTSFASPLANVPATLGNTSMFLG